MKLDNFLFHSLFFLLLGSAAYYVYHLNNLSLWGDELWLLSFISNDYIDLLKPYLLKDDPNYPSVIIFFKLFSFLFNTTDPNILVWANLFNIFFILLGIFLIKDYFSKDQIILFIALIVSSEYFIRFFLEIKTSGLILGLSCLFSYYFLKFYLSNGKVGFKGTITTGLILSTIHPLTGLFVCSCFIVMFFIVTNIRKYILIISFCFPIFILLTYSNQNIEDFHAELNFRHIMITAGFIIPVLFLSVSYIFFGFRNRFLEAKDHFFLFLPVILSLGVILIYSFLVMPMYQARYFLTFFPLTCLFLLLINKEYLHFIKFPLILSCLIFVIFFYGPRSQVPFTNYEDLINKSHTVQCKDFPIFFNNSKTGVQKVFDKTYRMASQIYSPNFQRKLISYDLLIATYRQLIKDNPHCKIVGISGQTRQEVFIEEIKNGINDIANDRIFKVTKIQAEDCVKPGCGLIWRVD